jgi:M6 family metalloprotease-like protein
MKAIRITKALRTATLKILFGAVATIALVNYLAPARAQINRASIPPIPSPSPVPTPVPVERIRAKYASTGGPTGFLGPATSAIIRAADGVGYFQNYQHGSIFWTQATGAHEVHGLIHQKWASLGWERSFLGYPTTDESSAPGGAGRYNNFQGGSIYWASATGAHEIHGAIRSKWLSLGGPADFLGYPLTDELRVGVDSVGRYNDFQGGSIYWSPASGAYEVHGLIRDKWLSLGGPDGSFLGYPLSDETILPNFSDYGRFNRFQKGFVYYTRDAGAVAVKDLAGDIFTRKIGQVAGRRPILTILWDPHLPGVTAPNRADVERVLFGAKPSVSDWYRENSGDKLKVLNAGVLGWYNAEKSADHYWDNQNTGDRRRDNDDSDYHHKKYGDGWLSGVAEMWAEAIRKAEQGFDFKSCDLNRDGNLTPDELGILIVIPQGAKFGSVNGAVGRQVPDEALVVDGVKIGDIAVWYLGDAIDLGTPAHELSHLLMDTPDLYQSHGQWPYTPGSYSIMAGGDVSHLDPFLKLKAGWLSSYHLALGSGEYLLRDVETNREVLVLYDPRRGPGEYFLIENRWRGTSYDAGHAGLAKGIPADGIAIWHIIEDPALHNYQPQPPTADNWGRLGIRMIRANGGAPLIEEWALFNAADMVISDDTNRARFRWIDGSRTGFEVRLITSPGPEMRLRITIHR